MSTRRYEVAIRIYSIVEDAVKGLRRLQRSVRKTKKAVEDASKATEKAVTREQVLLAMFSLGAGFSLKSISKQLGAYIDSWREAVVEFENASLRFQAAMLASTHTAEEMRSMMEKVRATGLFSERDIQLGFSYLAMLKLNREQMEELTDVVINAGLVHRNFAEAARMVTEYIEKGNTRLLSAIGIYITSNELKQKAIELYGREWNELTALEQAYVRYSTLLEHTENLTYLASLQSDSLAVAQMKLQAATEELNRELGEALVPTMTVLSNTTYGLLNLFKSLPDPVKNATASFIYLFQISAGFLGQVFYIGAGIQSLISLFKFLAPKISAAKDALLSFSAIASEVSAVLSSLASALPIIAAIAAAIFEIGMIVSPDARDAVLGFLEAIGLLQYIAPQFVSAKQAMTQAEQEFQDAINEANKEIAEYENRLQSLNQTKASLQEQIEDTQKELDKATRELEKWNRAVETATDRVESLNKRLYDLHTALLRAQLRMDRAAQAVIKAQWGIEEAQRGVIRAQWELMRADWAITRAEWRITRAEWKRRDAMRDVIRAQWKMVDATRAVTRARHNLIEKTWALEKAEYELLKLRREYADLRREVLFAENQLAIARKRFGEDSWEAYVAELNLLEMKRRLEDATQRVQSAEQDRQRALWDIEEAQWNLEKAGRQVTQAMWAMEDASRRLVEADWARQEAEWAMQEALWKRQEAEWGLQDALHKVTEAEWQYHNALLQQQIAQREYQSTLMEIQETEEDLVKAKGEVIIALNNLRTAYDNFVEVSYKLSILKDAMVSIEDEINNTETELENSKKKWDKIIDAKKRKLDELKRKFEEVRKALHGFQQDLGLAGAGVPGWIAILLKKLSGYQDIFELLGDTVKNLTNSISQMFQTASNNAASSASNIGNAYVDLYNSMVGRSIIPDLTRRMVWWFDWANREIKRSVGNVLEMVSTRKRLEIVSKFEGVRPFEKRIENRIAVNIHVDKMTTDNLDEVANYVAKKIAREWRRMRGVY